MQRLALLCALLLSTACHADIAIVASKDSPIDKLNAHEVADIFLAKSRYLTDGKRVTPLELRKSSYRATFYRDIAGKTLPQVNSYWTTLIFTGKGKPPRIVDSLEQVIELLNSNPYAISYLPLGEINETLKVLYIVAPR